MQRGPIMRFHKIVRRAGQPQRADKSAMCEINRQLLYCLLPSTPASFPSIVPVTRYARPFGEGLDGVSKGHDVLETGRCRWWETIHLRLFDDGMRADKLAMGAVNRPVWSI